MTTLKSDFDSYLSNENALKSERKKTFNFMKSMKRSKHDFKVAFKEFYYTLVELQHYQQLNTTAFRKIMKKHDKVGFSLQNKISLLLFFFLLSDPSVYRWNEMASNESSGSRFCDLERC